MVHRRCVGLTALQLRVGDGGGGEEERGGDAAVSDFQVLSSG
jgi:hypothetical protein